jgi:hypothetical protein
MKRQSEFNERRSRTEVEDGAPIAKAVEIITKATARKHPLGRSRV